MTTQQHLTDRVPESFLDLHQAIIDTIAGFETVVEKADPEFRPTARQFLTLHRSHHARLHALLPDILDEGEGVMGKINRAVVSMRSWFDEIDTDIMDQIRSGERSVEDAFAAAIRDAENSGDQSALQIMRGELADLLAETAHLD